MKIVVLLLVLMLASCSVVSPVYQFYAHKHAVPNWSFDYVEIPKQPPVTSEHFNPAYQGVFSDASNLISEHQRKIHSPGITAAVAIDGQLVWAGASGWADIEQKRPMTMSSQFRVGSTSKAINATLLAKLVEAGKLTLDTPISSFESGQMNQQWQNITPRQLASHSSGLPHYKDNNDWVGLYQTIALNTLFTDVAKSVDVFDDSDLLFSPGDEFSYSSLGTVLLSAVMQDSMSQTYQDAMKTQVFEPLSMTNSSADENVEHLVSFYLRQPQQPHKLAQWRDVDLSHRLAGGGFVSTSIDLVKLGLGFNSDEFLSKEVRDAFWTPQRLNNGEVNPQNYGIGWRVRESDFGEGVGTLFHANHGGVSRGAQSWLMVLPEHNMAVAVNINSKTDHFWDFGSVSYELVKLFLKHKTTL